MEIAEYITIKNSAGQTVAYLSPDDGLKNCEIDTRLNGESTLSFSLPANSEKLTEIIPECIISAGGREYTLLKEDAIDTERSQDGKLWAKFMTVESWYLLDTKYADPYINNDPAIIYPKSLNVYIVFGGTDLSGGLYTVGTAAHALYALLSGTGWTIGTVDVTGVHDLETEKESILANIKKVQEIWGGYLVWDSVNKTVSLRDETLWQNYTGFQIRYGKNLKSITKTQSNKIITRLYPFGKDDLDIAAVNGGLKYVQNTSYTSNIYIGVYKNEDIEDQTELKNKATAELAKICLPKYIYKVNAVDLRTLTEYSHEDFSVGDMADVVDDDIGTTKARIIRYKYNVFMPWQCELELGDPENRFVEQLKSSFNTTDYISTTLNSQGQFPGTKLTDLSVQTIKLTDLSVTYQKLGDASVTTAKIANLAVDTTKLAALAVGAAQLATGAVTSTKIANLAVEAAALATSSVTSTKIANAAVGTAAIANAAVGAAAIASAAIGSAHIGTGVILTAHIGDLQVVNAKIGDLAVNYAKIADLTITGAKIADATITNAKIYSLSADKITAGTIAATISITSPSITGGIFRTSPVGTARVEIYSAGVTVGSGGIQCVNANNEKAGFCIEYTADGVYNIMGHYSADVEVGHISIYPSEVRYRSYYSMNIRGDTSVQIVSNSSIQITAGSGKVYADGIWQIGGAIYYHDSSNFWNEFITLYTGYINFATITHTHGGSTGSSSHDHVVVVNGMPYTTSSNSHSHSIGSP